MNSTNILSLIKIKIHPIVKIKNPLTYKKTIDSSESKNNHFFHWAIGLLFLILTNCYTGRAIQIANNPEVIAEHTETHSIFAFGNQQSNYVMVLSSPGFWKDEILWDDRESMIPYFVSRGYLVYCISLREGEQAKQAYSQALESVLEKHSDSFVIIGGVSTGGQMVAETVFQEEFQKKEQIHSIFFLGTGFDYGYPNSLTSRFSKIRKMQYCPVFTLDCDLVPYISNPIHTPVEKVALGENPIDTKEVSVTSKIPVGFFWGKIDSIAPEESIYPFYAKIKGSKTFQGMSLANSKSIDFDHGNLIRGKEARNHVFPSILSWLESLPKVHADN